MNNSLCKSYTEDLKTVFINFPYSSQVTALFDQMEKEILNSEDFQATFELIHELFTACQKDVLVKKLFWQVFSPAFCSIPIIKRILLFKG